MHNSIIMRNKKPLFCQKTYAALLSGLWNYDKRIISGIVAFCLQIIFGSIYAMSKQTVAAPMSWKIKLWNELLLGVCTCTLLSLHYCLWSSLCGQTKPRVWRQTVEILLGMNKFCTFYWLCPDVKWAASMCRGEREGRGWRAHSGEKKEIVSTKEVHWGDLYM